MNPVYLLCGVSGSGKSYVAEKLTDKFHYIANDDFIGKDTVKLAAIYANSRVKPVLTDCPFGERELKVKLENLGLKVLPYFIIETPETVRQRYYARERKALPKAALTRATTIRVRALEWNAPMGTAGEILEKLRAV